MQVSPRPNHISHSFHPNKRQNSDFDTPFVDVISSLLYRQIQILREFEATKKTSCQRPILTIDVMAPPTLWLTWPLQNYEKVLNRTNKSMLFYGTCCFLRKIVTQGEPPYCMQKFGVLQILKSQRQIIIWSAPKFVPGHRILSRYSIQGEWQTARCSWGMQSF